MLQRYYVTPESSYKVGGNRQVMYTPVIVVESDDHHAHDDLHDRHEVVFRRDRRGDRGERAAAHPGKRGPTLSRAAAAEPGDRQGGTITGTARATVGERQRALYDESESDGRGDRAGDRPVGGVVKAAKIEPQ